MLIIIIFVHLSTNINLYINYNIMKKKVTFNSIMKFAIAFLVVMMSISVLASNNSKNEFPDNKKDLNSSEWQLYQENTGVQIYYKSVECNDEQNGIHQQYIVLKFVNTTYINLKLAWNTHLWIDGKCRTCKDTFGEYDFELYLKGGESIEGNCNSSKELAFFSKFLNYTDKSELTNFELAEFFVSPQ